LRFPFKIVVSVSLALVAFATVSAQRELAKPLLPAASPIRFRAVKQTVEQIFQSHFQSSKLPPGTFRTRFSILNRNAGSFVADQFVTVPDNRPQTSHVPFGWLDCDGLRTQPNPVIDGGLVRKLGRLKHSSDGGLHGYALNYAQGDFGVWELREPGAAIPKSPRIYLGSPTEKSVLTAALIANGTSDRF